MNQHQLAVYPTRCHYCNKKILVQMVMFGVPHNGTPSATCSDCIPTPLNEDFVREHPEDAKKIEEWLKEE